jgi:GDP-L-fucose synthase
MYDLAGKRVYVAGHNGMVGRAVVKALAGENCTVLADERQDADLLRQSEVETWMAHQKPDAVVVCAARVGDILANDTYPADFIYDNLMIEANLIRASIDISVEKLLFLGSSCIYPKLAPQPIAEEALLTGAIEPTKEWYAIAKIAGIKMCQAYRKQHGADFISAMPTNLYGPHDNFDLQSSHVIPALMCKCHEAKLAGEATMEVWGSVKVMREFLHVEDCAAGIVFLLKHYSDMSHVNLSTGEDVTIRQLAETITKTLGFEGILSFDGSKLDGTLRKLLDVSKINNPGWRHQIDLETGLAGTYQWFVENAA